jgi:hypothetical protein
VTAWEAEYVEDEGEAPLGNLNFSAIDRRGTIQNETLIHNQTMNPNSTTLLHNQTYQNQTFQNGTFQNGTFQANPAEMTEAGQRVNNQSSGSSRHVDADLGRTLMGELNFDNSGSRTRIYNANAHGSNQDMISLISLEHRPDDHMIVGGALAGGLDLFPVDQGDQEFSQQEPPPNFGEVQENEQP